MIKNSLTILLANKLSTGAVHQYLLYLSNICNKFPKWFPSAVLWKIPFKHLDCRLCGKTNKLVYFIS